LLCSLLLSADSHPRAGLLLPLRLRQRSTTHCGTNRRGASRFPPVSVSAAGRCRHLLQSLGRCCPRSRFAGVREDLKGGVCGGGRRGGRRRLRRLCGRSCSGILSSLCDISLVIVTAWRDMGPRVHSGCNVIAKGVTHHCNHTTACRRSFAQWLCNDRLQVHHSDCQRRIGRT
jgi:hypothetical protein